MTVADLLDHLRMLADAGLSDYRVMVAGHGALACLTRGTTEKAERVLLLYVEDDLAVQGSGATPGGEPGMAPQAPSAGTVSEVRPSDAEGSRGPLAMQANLLGEA